MKIKVNDKVKILSGKDRNKEGKVIQVFPVEGKVVVEGMNLVKKHVRARKQGAYLRGICCDPAGFEHHTLDSPKVSSNMNPKVIAILELTRDLLSRGEQQVRARGRAPRRPERGRRAEVPGAPESPSLRRNLMIALILGLLCAAGCIGLIEALTILASGKVSP